MQTPTQETNIGILHSTPAITEQEFRQSVDGGALGIILITYPSGTVPSWTIDGIRYAREHDVPVFGVRNIPLKDWTYEWDGTPVLPGLYEAETAAIREGLIPLRQDITDLVEGGLLQGLSEICRSNSTYESRRDKAKEKYSSPEFDARVMYLEQKT